MNEQAIKKELTLIDLIKSGQKRAKKLRKFLREHKDIILKEAVPIYEEQMKKNAEDFKKQEKRCRKTYLWLYKSLVYNSRFRLFIHAIMLVVGIIIGLNI